MMKRLFEDMMMFEKRSLFSLRDAQEQDDDDFFSDLPKFDDEVAYKDEEEKDDTATDCCGDIDGTNEAPHEELRLHLDADWSKTVTVEVAADADALDGGVGSVAAKTERETALPESDHVRVLPPPPPPSLRRKLFTLASSWYFWALTIAFFVCGVTTTGFIETHIVAVAVNRGGCALWGRTGAPHSPPLRRLAS